MLKVSDLISPAAYLSVVGTVQDANPGMDGGLAQRIADEGLKFVVACASTPGAALAPSRVVDEGWHALILHTKVYEELCASLGDFVHHYPGYDPDNYDPLILVRTQDAIRVAGYDVDEELWGAPTGEQRVAVAAKCQHSPSDTGPIKPMPTPRPPCRDKP
ncbi:glycine-rich domain-containing protein [Streptomyces angustmyceticus]|uniref:glycine-rich domain-containing protein n=1 Tax=Streptomyces angustmyceticus TaxID=285578 RepID=UPI003D8ABDE6